MSGRRDIPYKELLPHFHGTVENPSGLFQSDLCRPGGSILEGTWAETNDLVTAP